MLKFDWARDVPYKKGQEIEDGSFVLDVMDYSDGPQENYWDHLRVVRREGREIHSHDIPRCEKPEEVLLEHRQVTIYNPEDEPELDDFLKNCERAKAA